jgi:predicted glycogen debranching enzyme
MAERLHNFDYSGKLEWLETNGLGGYASASVSGANTRRYHGLLVAALNPPVERHVMLSKLDETIIVGDNRFELNTNQYPGALHPKGFQYLKSFQRDFFPVFIYEAGGVKLQKTIVALHGENTTIILYEVLAAEEKFELEFLPLCSFRDYHSLSHASDYIYKGYLFDNGVFRTKNYQESPEFFISIPQAEFQPTETWHYNLEYLVDQERGQDFCEDLFNHGRFTVKLKQGKKLGIIISTEDPTGRDAFKLYRQELKRRETLVKHSSWNEQIKRLTLAADQFIVDRGKGLKTIIAGYHWFSDWGRDTMIALPGLCLVTGRFDDAKKILKAFAESVSEGMLPNRFPDHGESPEYNTADATLWFFHAIYKYYQYTADIAFVKTLLPILNEIIKWHFKGTRYNIKVDEDGLLKAGAEGVQLTWMDAKVNGYVVTPRAGKAVEINALWYNALSIMAEFSLLESGNSNDARLYEKQASEVKEQFNKQFWNDTRKCLYDVIDGDYKNDDIRPNQIFVLSLPFKLLTNEKSLAVLQIVSQKLLTLRGLRSLSASHSEYKPHYEGNQWQRDNAYHQGTVWSYLLGPYIDALINLKGSKGKQEAVQYIKNFFVHLDEAGVGSVSEIFDGAPPHQPRGCIAQAWSVAEILRVSIEYNFFENPDKKKKAPVNRIKDVLRKIEIQGNKV